MTIATDVRGALATALGSLTANVYNDVPEAPMAPCVCIVPDTNYLVPNLINKSAQRFEVNLIISVAVAYNSNVGALDNLEQLVIAALAAIPSGYVVNSIESPRRWDLTNASLLGMDIHVTTYYQQGA